MNTSWVHGIVSVAPYFYPLFLGIAIDIVLFRRYRQRRKIDDHLRNTGIRTTGRIVNRRKGIVTFDLVYVYEIQGKSYGQVQHVDAETFNSVNQGDDIIVCYDLERHEKSVILEIYIAYVEFQLAFTLLIIVVLYGLMLVIIAIIALLVTYLHF